ncbi:FecR domain-containing protein [Opitutus sp. ER46]|uniref:FecR family protein n=1 Tax=Opitutus sp. ER46 TaxID=2161864 RepID=UPI000D30F3AA|nr:FecR domain-containing protein [Opitutus sp. ER46]PTX92518.1 hypothetical protein DB354_14400 [Opitutus sp. ER46]
MDFEPDNADPISAEASRWLARRDRGLSAAEQDRYLEWLQRDPRHREAVAELENGWTALDRLKEWRPSDSHHPNPDLLAPRRARWPYWLSPLAAAAAILLGIHLYVAAPSTPASPPQQAILHPAAECLVLEDGSTVKLNAGAQVKVEYTATERRVVLVRGEGLFTVAKNPDRPFIVAADCVAVRALGTTFAVALKPSAVSVLVTEGKVRVDETPDAGASVPAGGRELSHIVAGQQAVIARPDAAASRAAEPDLQLRDVTPADIERALAWQNLRLEFVDMPLRQVVTEFNRYNVRKLAVADDATGAIVIGGSFRADQVESFVRLLATGFGVSSSPRGDEIVLRKEP